MRRTLVARFFASPAASLLSAPRCGSRRRCWHRFFHVRPAEFGGVRYRRVLDPNGQVQQRCLGTCSATWRSDVERVPGSESPSTVLTVPLKCSRRLEHSHATGRPCRKLSRQSRILNRRHWQRELVRQSLLPGTARWASKDSEAPGTGFGPENRSFWWFQESL